jgi:thioredoxin reductase (NADPH)
MSSNLSSDLLIVGAGPVGLYAAYCAGFRGLSMTIVDSLPEPGGQVSALYPEKLIYDVAALPAVRGRDLVDSLVAQAGRFAPRYLLGEQALTLDRTDAGRLVVGTSAGTRIDCGAIVITGGIGTFTPRPLPVGTEYLGRGLSYFVPDPNEHVDRDVVVVGGGDSAVDWALTLETIARSVTLVHRRAAFRAHAHSVSLLRDSNVRVLTEAEVTAIHGNGWLNAVDVTVRYGGGTAVETAKAQAVIAALGFTARLGPLEQWGMATAARHLLVDSTMRTSVPSVFAAGDITEYRGKVRLISVGFGEAAIAVNNAAVELNPALDLFPGHSSDSI